MTTKWLGVSALPVRPAYPFGDPGAPIELYSGPIAVDFIGLWEGRIFAGDRPLHEPAADLSG
jgi:hypothetical protein